MFNIKGRSYVSAKKKSYVQFLQKKRKRKDERIRGPL